MDEKTFEDPVVKDFSLEDLKNQENQKRVFEVMLHTLEVEGKCKYVFHRLALTLFGDTLEG